jgi:CheY-like chemotaxis protein
MHIVVADPSRTVLKVISRLLESGGHSGDAFTDGRDALKSPPIVDALTTTN